MIADSSKHSRLIMLFVFLTLSSVQNDLNSFILSQMIVILKLIFSERIWLNDSSSQHSTHIFVLININTLKNLFASLILLKENVYKF
jgi:hypothetical protein